MKNKFALLLVVTLLIGTSLRIYKLGSRDVWFDEAQSVYFSENIAQTYSLSRLTRDIPYANPTMPHSISSYPYKSPDPNPPLYYMLLHIWTIVFGKSEFSIRLLSLIFGIFSISIFYKFCRLFSEKKVSLFATFILSISPMHIWYAQEARSYSLCTFLVLLSAYLLFLSFKKDKNLFWLTFIVSFILSLYANYFAFYIIAVGWIMSLWKKDRRIIKKWSIINIIIFASFLPWIPFFKHHFLYVKDYFWISRPSFKSIVITFENFNLGYNGFQITYLLSSIIFLSLLFFGIYCFDKEKRLFLASFLFIPISLTFAISQKMPIYIDRQLMLFSPFYYILVAQGVMKIKARMAKNLIIALISLLIISSLNNYFTDHMPVLSPSHHQGVHAKKPIKPAINYIEENWQKDDRLIVSHISLRAPFLYYKELYKLKQNNNNNFNCKRIWLVSSSWARDGKLEPGIILLKNALSSRYTKIKSLEFDGIYIDLFSN